MRARVVVADSKSFERGGLIACTGDIIHPGCTQIPYHAQICPILVASSYASPLLLATGNPERAERRLFSLLHLQNSVTRSQPHSIHNDCIQENEPALNSAGMETEQYILKDPGWP